MTSDDRLARRLTARLDERAAPRAPDGLAEAVAEGVAGTKQRPAWATTERWISMETRAQFGAVPRAVIVLATLALLTALAASAIVIGSSTTSKLPPPFGVAGNGLIAFVSDGDIWAVNPDGTGAHRLTSGPEDDFGPEWSRDGTRLAYWSRADAGPPDLVVIDADGGEPVTVATMPGPEVRSQAAGWLDGAVYEWSADGTEIMYSALVPGLGADPCPVSSSDGGECGSRLFIARTDGSGVRSVGDPELDVRSPTLSPDGSTVAFGGGSAGSATLHVMQWDGSDLRPLGGVSPTGGWAFLHQSWSPDGKRIATHGHGNPQQVWLVELDGSGVPRVLDMPAEVRFPYYAPDGGAILVDNNAGMTLWTIDTDEPPLVTAFGFPEGWSPDGTQFLGRRYGPDSGPLVVFDRDGEVATEIDAADGPGVSWQRIAP